MRAAALTLAALLALLLFPWPFAALLALLAGVLSPFALLAAGLFADTLYFSHGLPWWTIIGAVAAGLAFFVRRFIETSIMRA